MLFLCGSRGLGEWRPTLITSYGFEFCEFSSPHDRVEAPSRGSAKDQKCAFFGHPKMFLRYKFSLVDYLVP